MDSILVSVIMTSFNREEFVGAAIESVLASSYTEFEFIICDDCSSDRSYQIEQSYALKDSRIKLFRNSSNLGDFPNRDKAASYASGIYLKFVDSDDIIYPDGLKIMMDAMLKFPDAVLGLSQFENKHNQFCKYPVLISSEQAFLEHFNGYEALRYGPTGAIIKKDLLFQMGGFGENRFIGDTELWLKIVAIHPLVKIQAGLVEWQRHNGQEFHYGMINDIYIQKAYPVYMASLKSPDCPLQPADIAAIVRRLQWKHARDIISVAVRKRKLKLAWDIFHEADFGVFKLLYGLWPYFQSKNTV